MKWGTAFGDFDNDGWPDLVAVAGHVYPQIDLLQAGPRYREPALLNMNQHDGKFCDASSLAGPAFSVPRVARGLAVGDLFNRGQLDVVVETLDGIPVLLKNNGIAGRHWVSFDLVGTKSNRMALNARIRIVAGGMTQSDEVHSGGSYLSQSDTRIHFGLENAAKIDSVEIHWPSGQIEQLNNLPVDQFYTVLEGKGAVPAGQAYPSLRNGSSKMRQ